MKNTKNNQTIIALKYASLFIVLFWIIQLIQIIGFELNTFGILPRTKSGTIGILTSPLVHGSMNHLIANTIPFFILSFLLFLSHKKMSILYLILIWISTGFLTWLIGRTAWHIGASGVIYGMASFLVVSGILSYKWKLILVSVIVSILYSQLIWGLFPSERSVSWEGHLSGAISGVLWALVYKNKLRDKAIK